MMRHLLVLLFVSLTVAVTGLHVRDTDFLQKSDGDHDGDHSVLPLQNHQRYRRRASRSRGASPARSDLQKKLEKVDKPAFKRLAEKLREKLNEVDDMDDFAENVEATIKSLNESWDALTGNNVKDIAKAVCDIVGTVAAFIPPPAGIAISTVMSVVSLVLGMGGGKQERSMGDVVQEVIERQLKKQYVDEMSDRVQGAVDYLELNQVFLNGFTNGSLKDLSDRDYQFMITYFDHLTGMSLRSELANLAARLGRTKKVEDAKDAISVFDSYVVLTSMVEVLMHTMKSILEEDTRTMKSAQNVGLAIEAARRQTRRHLSILRKPKLENAMLVANYVPTEHENVETTLDNLNVTALLTIDSGCYTMLNKHFNTYASNVQHERFSSMNFNRALAGIPENVSSVFEFRKAVGPKSTLGFVSYHIRNKNGSTDFGGMGNVGNISSENNKNIAVGSTFVTKLNETNQVPFKIVGFLDGGIMIINEKWPTNPISLANLEWKYLPVTADTQPWNEETPEYIWLLTKEEGNCSTRVASDVRMAA